jgi:hypothetical protein
MFMSNPFASRGMPLIAASLLAVGVGSAQGTLKGDNITGTLDNFYLPGGNYFDASTATAGDGLEFEMVGDQVDPDYGLLYTFRISVDVSEDLVVFRQVVDIPFVAGIGGTTYTISWRASLGDLDWHPPTPIAARTVSSSGIDFLSFDGRRLDAFVPGLQFRFGINGPGHIDQSLVVQLVPIPEAPSGWLFALGLAALLQRRHAQWETSSTSASRGLMRGTGQCR